jgi:predicted nucleic acid-binding protein
VIVLDACVPIAHRDATDPHHDRASALLLGEANSTFGASPITLAEVLIGPAHAGQLERAAAALHQLDLITLPRGEDAPARLASLRASTGLELPDCGVVLAAEQARGSVATVDDRLAAASRNVDFPVRDRWARSSTGRRRGRARYRRSARSIWRRASRSAIASRLSYWRLPRQSPTSTLAWLPAKYIRSGIRV